mmetsp:Transcript_5384/g.7581  ORF Transcript_5384/g.7581 Transcript_5384/m.7581 type:complete len:212 (+) Transcript_5384:171-806(+)
MDSASLLPVFPSTGAAAADAALPLSSAPAWPVAAAADGEVAVAAAVAAALAAAFRFSLAFSSRCRCLRAIISSLDSWTMRRQVSRSKVKKEQAAPAITFKVELSGATKVSTKKYPRANAPMKATRTCVPKFVAKESPSMWAPALFFLLWFRGATPSTIRWYFRSSASDLNLSKSVISDSAVFTRLTTSEPSSNSCTLTFLPPNFWCSLAKR